MTTPSERTAAAIADAPPFVPRVVAGADLVRHAAPPEREAGHDPEPGNGPSGWDEVDDLPPPGDDDGADPDIVRGCAVLDHSDTDNAERLIRHFGQDLAVLAQEGTPGGDWLGWSGDHWDLAGGAARVRLTVQRLGGRIMREAEWIRPTEQEAGIVEEAKPLRRLADDDVTPDQLAVIKQADKIVDKVAKRKERRRAFGVTSKNKARMESTLDCAAPRLRRAPEAFNPDRYRFACLTHTVQLTREPDQDVTGDGQPRFVCEAVASPGHDRDDWITSVLPVPWDPEAKAARWRAFLARMLPDEAKRRTVQQFAGLGLLGIPVQYVMFHYGLGANGKSVFLETLVRVLGPGLAVGLPRESIVGASERAAGGASPDLVRLYGKRMVRILEVKGNVPLQEDLIKRLTGGEAFPVRTLFKGYFEFQSVATPHMSGNGKPSIDGTDNGIWRRMLLVHWDQVIPEAERRDLEDVVGGFVRDEGAGILAWLVEGALDYLQNGLVVAPAVVGDTQEYRDEMDPIGLFTASCVRPMAGERVPANELYQAYEAWSAANAKKAATIQKFGRVMAERFHKSEIGGRVYYRDIALVNVPERPADPRNPYAEVRG